MEIRAQAADYRNCVELLVMEKRDGKFYAASPVTMEEREPNMYLEPTLRLGMGEAQTLIDDLWKAGLRPSEGTGSAGSLKATENHLSDMRKIVSKKLGIEF